MAEKEPTQRTPKGYEIPVPSRERVFSDLDKAAKPLPSRRRKRGAKKK